MYYYLEKDGQVFLIKKGGVWTFPTTKKEIPCSFTEGKRLPIKEEVVFCHPEGIDFPKDWVYKDDVPTLPVAPIVQLAINRSLVRQLANGVVEKDGKILMVKSIRGMGSGFWKLPGGFVSFGESPHESVLREIEEETGIRAKIGKLLLVDTGIRELYFTSFSYSCTFLGGTARADGKEIGEVRWISLADAIKEVKQPFVKNVLEVYQNSR